MLELEDFKTQFDSLNIKTNGQVLQKCVEISSIYNLSPEDFVDEWLAFSASNLNGAPPSLDALDRMERKILKQTKSSAPVSIYQHSVPTTPVRQKSLQHKAHLEAPLPMQVEEIVPSDDWSKRKDSGSVVDQFGQCGNDTFKQRSTATLNIKILNKELSNGTYMYEKFLSRQACQNEISRFVICDILNHHRLELTQENFKQYSGDMTVCGRIYSDTPGKMELGSIYLEGLVNLYRGQRIKLNFDHMDRMSIFNGQAVVVSGNNVRNWFTVKKIYTGSPLPPPENPIEITETVQIMVAAGPFTLQNNLKYEALDSLLKHTIESKPNLLILMGPFLDEAHPDVENMDECYDVFFEYFVDGIMKRLMGTDVKVLLVPSHKDIHGHAIFPTLPFTTKLKHNGLYLAPNPFMIDIDGLVIGGSPTDAIFHLAKVEVYKGGQRERMNELISNLFKQRSFYPMCPSDPDIPVDYQLMEQYGMIKNGLHILIIPSNFKHSIKVIEDCVVINPQRLTIGNSGGTFAKIEIRAENKKISERVSCQIYRV